MNPSCSLCKFWRRWIPAPAPAPGTPAHLTAVYGDCRRHAPSLLVQAGVAPRTKWPSTAATDYCGSFKPEAGQ